MATDWSTPTTTSNYSTEVLQSVNGKIESAAKADYGTDTNVPTGALRFNSTTKKWEEWGGASWVIRDLIATGLEATNVIINGITDTIIQKDGVDYVSVGVDPITSLEGMKLHSTSFFQLKGDNTSINFNTGSVDGADSKSLEFSGGGAYSHLRGANVGLFGNEHASTGQLYLGGGSAVGGDVIMAPEGVEEARFVKGGGIQLQHNHDTLASTPPANKFNLFSSDGFPQGKDPAGRHHFERVTYTPVVTPTTGAWTHYATYHSHYFLIGRLCFFSVYVYGNNNSITNDIDVSMPFTQRWGTSTNPQTCFMYNGTWYPVGICYTSQSNAYVRISKWYNNTQFGVGDKHIILRGFFEAAI